MVLILPSDFFSTFWPCLDIAFAQLGVIKRTKNKFVEIVAAAECYLIANNIKNIKEAAIPNIPSCKISWWKNVSEKGKKLLALNLKHFQFGQDFQLLKNMIFNDNVIFNAITHMLYFSHLCNKKTPQKQVYKETTYKIEEQFF